MRLTIDKRPNGFRVQWQDGKGQQGRAQFSTEVAMRDFLSRFDFVNGRESSVEQVAAASFAEPQIEIRDTLRIETLPGRDVPDGETTADRVANALASGAAEDPSAFKGSDKAYAAVIEDDGSVTQIYPKDGPSAPRPKKKGKR